MQHITKSNTTSSSPSDTGLLRQFYEKQLNGSATLLRLRYHVWQQGNTIKDAYWEEGGSKRVFSYNQIKTLVATQVLEPADQYTKRIFQRPSQQAEMLAAA